MPLSATHAHLKPDSYGNASNLITEREHGQALQEQTKSPLRNYLHPRKATERSEALRAADCDPYLSLTNVGYGRHNGQSGPANIHCSAASFPALNNGQSGSIR
jgi:hypothetical protein